MSEPLDPAESSERDQPALVATAISRVQQEPVKAVGSAFVVGLVLSLFPVGRIVSAIAGLALALLRPALMLFGAFKVWEEFGRQKK